MLHEYYTSYFQCSTVYLFLTLHSFILYCVSVPFILGELQDKTASVGRRKNYHGLILDFMKPCKISAHSDDIFLWGVRVIWMSWNFVRFHETMQKISDFYLDKQYFLKLLSIPCSTMDSSFFGQQIAPWHPNFPHQRLCCVWLNF